MLKRPKRYEPDIILLLNYLDSIAIGVEQGLYISSRLHGTILSKFSRVTCNGF
jgi:hypothetical protein